MRERERKPFHLGLRDRPGAIHKYVAAPRTAVPRLAWTTAMVPASAGARIDKTGCCAEFFQKQ